tara:strand:- start:201 stop:428 length:228 start_codon:yes stop_codon:yes gene_type:complete
MTFTLQFLRTSMFTTSIMSCYPSGISGDDWDCDTDHCDQSQNGQEQRDYENDFSGSVRYGLCFVSIIGEQARSSP